jgi:hypothetical protein
MAKVRLGRDQTLTLDGTPLEGVREVDIQVDMQGQDVTAFDHSTTSTLPIRQDVTLRTLIYHKDDYDRIRPSFSLTTPRPVTLAISNVASAQFVPVAVKIAQPVDGVMAWDVTWKTWNYS